VCDVCNISSALPVVCAVVNVNATDYDVILLTDVVKELRELPTVSILLDLFVNVDVPNVIISDCRTNFTSSLTQELLYKLGCSP